MFTDFLFLLRAHGMKTGLTEWNTLMEALDQNLNEASLIEFYHMARAILVKKVSDFDKFDEVFLEYFENVVETDGLPAELLQWLSKSMTQTGYDKEEIDSLWSGMDIEQIKALMAERLKEQKEQHHGGTKWVGTGGNTPFGHSGYAPMGIRVHGEGQNHSALKVAGARNFKDFREDKVLQIRDFQVALRKLRLLSNKDEGAKTELDVEGTIAATCKQGGQLKIVMEHPRKNQTKLLLLMDSGGSMWSCAELCNRLFRAVNEGASFKDLKIYYFHNCFYDHLFTEPRCKWDNRVDTNWVLNNLKSEYKVIIVGDATMGPAELMEPYGTLDDLHPNKESGMAWLKKVKKKFPACIWLNPLHYKLWDWDYSSRTVGMVREVFPMYQLTAKGLEQAIQYLLKN